MDVKFKLLRAIYILFCRWKNLYYIEHTCPRNTFSLLRTGRSVCAVPAGVGSFAPPPELFGDKRKGLSLETERNNKTHCM